VAAAEIMGGFRIWKEGSGSSVDLGTSNKAPVRDLKEEEPIKAGHLLQSLLLQ